MKCRHKTIPRKTPPNLTHSVAGKLLSSKCRVGLQCRAKPCRNVWRARGYKIKINISLLSLVCFVRLSSFPFSFCYFARSICFLEDGGSSAIASVRVYPLFFYLIIISLLSGHCFSIELNWFHCLFSSCTAGWQCVLSTHLLSTLKVQEYPSKSVCV